MTSEAVLQAVCAFCEAAAGLPFGTALPGDAGNVRPGVPFLSVTIVSDVPVGRPVPLLGIVEIDGDPVNVEQIVQMRDVRVSVNGYGQASQEWLNTIALAWVSRRPGGAGETLRTAGVHVREATAVQRRSALLQTQIEPRWGLDLRCYVSREATVSPEVDGAASVVLDVDVSRESEVITAAHAEVEAP